MAEAPAARRRKVAVVAVHGVGVHPPGENQNAMADLLLSCPPREYDAPRTYDPFVSVGIQIPLQPLKAEPFPPPQRQGFFAKLVHLYDEQSLDFALKARILGEKRIAEQQQSSVQGEAGRRYTQMLLDGYEGGSEVAGNKYTTARLEGRRVEDNTDVHIYEVLWADLAKPNNTFVKFFLAVFQLLLHLASLSRTALDTGATEGTTNLWRYYRRGQRYAVRILLIFHPLFQLLLAITVASCLSTASSYTSGQIAVPLALGVAGGLAFGFYFIVSVQNKITFAPWLWSVLAIAPGVCGAAVSYAFIRFLMHFQHANAAAAVNTAAVIAFWLVPGLGFFLWILFAYEPSRKGVFYTGISLFALSFLHLLISIHHLNYDVVHAVYVTGRTLLGALRVSWILLVVLAFATLILGSLAWRSETDPASRARARSAVRTSRFALALPTVSFTLVTLGLWEALVELVNKINPDIFATSFAARHHGASSPTYTSHIYKFFHYSVARGEPGAGTAQYLQDVLAWAVGYQLPITLLLVALAGFLLIWWALPSAVTERFPYRQDHEAPRDTNNLTSLHMGTWLSRGLDSTSVITGLLWCSIFLAPAAYMALQSASTPGTIIEELSSTSSARHTLLTYPVLSRLP